MKENLQAPKPKHQRRSKPQARKMGDIHRPIFTYQSLDRPSLVSNEMPETPRHPFDLEDRTARFGEAIVRFSKKIPRHPTNDRLIDQLVGCGTSIGGNYCEAKELHLIFASIFRKTKGQLSYEAGLKSHLKVAG